jgi:hypothetical protein
MFRDSAENERRNRWVTPAGAPFVAALVVALLSLPPAADACCGPGTAAGGVQVWSARTIPSGSLDVLLRADYTRFESLSPEEIEAMTLHVSGDHQHFDVVDQSMLATLGFMYGLTDDLELGVLFSYYGGSEVGEGHAHGGASYEFDDYGDVAGVADTWLATKWRVRSSPGGDVAVIGGLKAPTGEDNVTYQGEPIDQALQPGSGSWDVSLAVAFTRDLGPRVTLDASAQYILRTEANDYQVGDQTNVGIACAARIAGGMPSTRTLWAFVEASLRDQAENEEDGEAHVNSGGTTVYVTPGLRATVSSRLAVNLSVQVPVVQELNDVQQDVDYKLTASVTMSF